MQRIVPDASTDALHGLAFETAMALIAKHGGGADTLGSQMPLAREAWQRSLLGHAFPSFWLEVPLLDEPGFDLHVYYDRDQMCAHDRFAEGCGFGCQAMFDWFLGEETGGVGVGFPHDLHGDSIVTGAYVNFNYSPLDDLPGFFSSLQAEWAAKGMRDLMARAPQGWHSWYAGAFVGRAGSPARLGCFFDKKSVQSTYAADADCLARDLRRMGFSAFDGNVLSRVSELASLPFQLELQLDLEQTGEVGNTLGLDLTIPSGNVLRTRELFASGNAGEKTFDLLESWGMADGRWHVLMGATMGKAMPLRSMSGGALGDGLGNQLGNEQGIARGNGFGNESELALGSGPGLARENEFGIGLGLGLARGDRLGLVLTCHPVFIKAKWRDHKPQPAKLYLHCNTTPVRLG